MCAAYLNKLLLLCMMQMSLTSAGVFNVTDQSQMRTVTNEERETITTQSGLPVTEVLQNKTIACYTGMKLSGQFLNQNQWTEERCQNADFVCLETVAEFQRESYGVLIKGKTILGQCIPKIACQSATCDQIKKTLSTLQLPFKLEFKQCKTKCCDWNLCNSESDVNQVRSTQQSEITSVYETYKEKLRTEADLTQTPTTYFPIPQINVEEIWRRAANIESEVQQLIPSFYFYEYDGVNQYGPVNDIAYGGSVLNAIFYHGNRVRFYTGSREPSFIFTTPLGYNSVQRNFDYDIKIGGDKHPFMALAWIKNPTEEEKMYSFQIRGYVPVSHGKVQISSNGNFSSEDGSVFVKYIYYHSYLSDDPSVMELYFVLSNKHWGSELRSNFFVYHFSGLGDLANTVRLQGNPKNVLMGYILFSKTDGKQIFDVDLQRILRRLAELIAQVSFEANPPIYETTPEKTTEATRATETSTARIDAEPTTSKQETSSAYSSTISTIPHFVTRNCGSDITVTTTPQEISTPGYPGYYFSNKDCEWVLRSGTLGSTVVVEFDEFEIQYCCDDHVNIIRSGSRFYQFRGVPALGRKFSLTSDGIMIIRFHSGEYGTDIGFHASVYETISATSITTDGFFSSPTFALPTTAPFLTRNCGRDVTVTAQPQELSSPGYPGYYYGDKDCEWVLESSIPNSIIHVNFDEFYTRHCCDYVTIIRSGGRIEEYYNRYDHPIKITSINKMIIRFHSDTFNTANGFHASTYEVVPTEVTILPHESSTSEVIATTSGGCGGVIQVTSIQQEILSPDYPWYRVNQECEWVLMPISDNENYISIRFTEFQTEECCDYVRISQEGQSEIDYKGKLDVPFTITRRGRTTIKFYSDRLFPDLGFRALIYGSGETITTVSTTTTTEARCSGTILVTSTQQTFQSPNFPLYLNNENCEWILEPTGSEEMEIFMQFLEFATEKCCDYVTISQPGKDDKVFNGYPEVPFVVKTNGRTTVRFRSVNNFQTRGFRSIIFGSTPSSSMCTSSGSPCVFPFIYRGEIYGSCTDINNDNILWCSTTGNYDESSQWGNCVLCSDIAATTKETLHSNQTLPQATPATTRTTSTPAAARTTTIEEIDHRDQTVYQATPETISTTTMFSTRNCGSDIVVTSQRQEISSPGYPSYYYNNKDCEWVLKSATPGSEIIIQFDVFETQECCDYVKVIRRYNNLPYFHDYRGRPDRQRFSKFSQGVMIVRFHSDSFITNMGFHGWVYESVPSPLVFIPGVSPETETTTAFFPRTCGTDISLTSQPQEIFSPGYPGNYLGGKNCAWVLESSTPGSIIHIDFDVFQTQGCCDYVTIIRSGTRIEEYKGKIEVPFNVTSVNKMIVRFRSSTFSYGLGFHAVAYELVDQGLEDTVNQLERSVPSTSETKNDLYQYKSLTESLDTVNISVPLPTNTKTKVTTTTTTTTTTDASSKEHGCDSVIQVSSIEQEIHSPDYPGYLSNQDCEFILMPIDANQDQVHIRFVDFHTEFCCDYVKISQNGREDFEFKGPLDTPFTIHGNGIVTVRFHSDHSDNYRGFRAFVYGPEKTSPSTSTTTPPILGGCGGTITVTAIPQEFRSPDYPSYENNQNCQWLLEPIGPYEMEIFIHFVEFSTESCCDYVKIAEPGQVERDFRGNLDVPFTVQINRIRETTIQFVSDSSFTKVGFRAIVFGSTPSPILCTTSGAPCVFPFIYNADVYDSCIDLDNGNVMWCATTANYNEDSLRGNCAPCSATIMSTTTSSSTASTSTTSTLTTATPVSAASVATSFGCGSTISVTNQKTYITSPNYPRNYPDQLVCEWFLLPSTPGSVISILFHDFSTEECCDYVVIEEIGQDDRRISGEQNSTLIQSNGGNVVLRLITDISETARGFRASVYVEETSESFVPASIPPASKECGSTIYVSFQRQRITSPNYPLPYSNNQECTWILEPASPGSTVNIEFLQVDTESCCDVVTIKESGKDDQRVSGQPKNVPFTVDVSGRVFITFESDSSKTFNGFSADIFEEVESTEVSKHYEQDECSDSSNCHLYANCIGDTGSRTCVCNNGFTGNGFSCDDINECVGSNGCQLNSICNNTPGSFYCVCNPGFERDGDHCQDIDECASENNCNVSAFCINVHGSYSCSCMDGFTGNGYDCIDINECDNPTSPCKSSAICCNTAGSFTCTCGNGFIGNGSEECVDIDECAVYEMPCGRVNNQCVNTIGSFSCACSDGYVLNKTSCILIRPKPPTEAAVAYAAETVAELFFAYSRDAEDYHVYVSCNDGEFIDNIFTKNSLYIPLSAIPHNSSCYVQVRSRNPNSIEKFSDFTDPAPFRTRACGGTVHVTSRPRTFHTGIPALYPANITCYWTLIPTSATSKIHIQFFEFGKPSCCDELTVEEADGESSKYLVNIDTEAFETITTGKTVVGFYYPHISISYVGFYAITHETFDEVLQTTPQLPASCNFSLEVTDQPQSIISPGYSINTGRYDNGLKCRWTLTAVEPNGMIRIQFNYFHTEECCDKLKIFEDGRETQQISGFISSGETHQTTASTVSLLFETDGTVIWEGFNLSVVSINEKEFQNLDSSPIFAPCGFSAIADRLPQALRSPKWPRRYPNSLICNWTITTNIPNARIQIDFSSFRTESCCDTLKIFENNVEVESFAGSVGREQYNSSGSLVVLRFRSDASISYDGFDATFKAISNKIITQDSLGSDGIIEDDEEFLPSCTVKQAVRSVFRCEYIFASPNNYSGVETCRLEIDRTIRCVTSQLLQCGMGGGSNKWDCMNIPSFNMKNVLDFMSSLLKDPSLPHNLYIDKFCTYAERNHSYPDVVPNFGGFCEQEILDQLLTVAKDFYFSYIHAVDRAQICSAFRVLKQQFTNRVELFCDYNTLLSQQIPEETRKYIYKIVRVAYETSLQLESTACEGSYNYIDDFKQFGCFNS